MVRRSGDNKKFPGGPAAERLKQFEIERGLRPEAADEGDSNAPKPGPAPKKEPPDAG
jgi:hypothetical protein